MRKIVIPDCIIPLFHELIVTISKKHQDQSLSLQVKPTKGHFRATIFVALPTVTQECYFDSRKQLKSVNAKFGKSQKRRNQNDACSVKLSRRLASVDFWIPQVQYLLHGKFPFHVSSSGLQYFFVHDVE